ncbi:transcription elongation factor GreA [Lactobacillus sp. ESL0791]|uniref:transcription elongation factor GreA n=1 Tax=Lactobacillus sp. ESL0791 TaxID=2983234 RepID=UPI0023F8073A|nr:transcription elongation factor GreA [Lactobacillus sp. ESL0791]MDF7639609.1 transcription elongation factor GreA [Lactobacillus sp. ESL0791]
MVYFQKMTPDGYQKIKDEIAQLKKERPRRIKILQEARSMGDLSENSEYTEAKRDLGHLQSRLRYLDKQLKYAEIVEKSADGTVDLGKTVQLKFADDEEVETYQIVGRLEADLDNGKMAFDSPLGQAIMKKTAGTTVTVAAPAGAYQVTIVTVVE